MEEIAAKFHTRSDFLYLGRGINYPIALEGALKLKEISYIHAEGYPAGEMKHGPIALIDEQMPVVAIATHDHVFEKMQGNIQEAKARGGSIIAITTKGDTTLKELLTEGDSLVAVPATDRLLMPVVISLPLQLLSYYIAVRRGCDVDQPRNLAKSVTCRVDIGQSLDLLSSLKPCTARSCSTDRRSAADSGRGRLGKDARHRASHRLSRLREDRLSRSDHGGHLHEQGRPGNARARRAAARDRLPRDVGVDVPRLVRAPVAPRGPQHRPQPRFHDLRLRRSAGGHQAAAQGLSPRRRVVSTRGWC